MGEEDITVDTEEIERITMSYFNNLFFTKLENPKEINNSLIDIIFQS